MKQHSAIPSLGFGLGLRVPHYPHIFERTPAVDWFEIISENFMDTEGRPLRNLSKIRAHYPVVMHGVALSIGTVDTLNSEYLLKLKKLKNWLKPALISDHLCWTGIAHKNTHDLLPMPYTEAALKHTIQRLKEVQDFLEQPIALENPSTYLEFQSSQMPEAEFIARMSAESGCLLLLDVNNVYVSCYNHRLDPKAYIDALPLDSVAQIHLSGHTNNGTHIIDTHDDYVVEPVWSLYKYVVAKAGRVPNTMVEWDDAIPDFTVLEAELDKARRAAKDAQDYAPLPTFAASPRNNTAPRDESSLRQTQETLQNAILSGNSSDADAWIAAKDDFSAAAQLGVYTNAYRFRLYNLTHGEYPVLRHYMGDAAFAALLDDFVAAVESQHFNISRYTAMLPDFLAKHALYSSAAHEIARLEDAVSQLADYPETQPLEAAHLEGISPEQFMDSVLYPRTALQLFAFSYPVNRYYRDVKEDRAPEAPTAEPSYVAVYRHDDTVWRLDLTAPEYSLLSKLFAAVPIGAALEQLTQETALSETDLSAQLSHWFASWMRNGLLAAPPDIYHITPTERTAA